MFDFIQPIDYWDARARNPYSAVRSGWTRSDFEKRTDETVALLFDEPPTGAFLDLGCGLGYACKAVKDSADYYGVDWSHGMIEVATEMNPEATAFLWGDGKKIPFPDGFFQCAISEQMFIHLTRDDTYAYFQELMRTVSKEMILEIPKAGEYVNGWTDEELSEVFMDIEFVPRESPCYYAKVYV